MDFAEAFYSKLVTVFTSNAALVALVPAANIKPSFDPSQDLPGCCLVFAFEDSQFDLKTKKGRCTITMGILNDKNKVDAQKIMALVRPLMTARNISTTDFKAGLVEELNRTSDNSIDPLKRFVVSSAWKVMFRKV